MEIILGFIIPVIFIILSVYVIGGAPIWISYAMCAIDALFDEKMHKKEAPVVFW